MRKLMAAVAGALILAGCGSADSEPETTETVYVTVPADPPSDEQEAPTEPEAEAEGGARETAAAESSPEEPSKAEQPEAGVVPDVVGLDHQLAQDTMQAAGYYNLSEEDATGQGRMLLYDRNWEVVEQSPAAGTEASPDTTIILRSKKDGE